MKLLPSYRICGLIFVASSIAAGVGIAACSSSSEAPAAGTPDSGVADAATNVEDSSSQPVTDAATPDDGDAGEEITDGGDLPPVDDDGGTTDLDGGFDGGAACASLTAGSYVQSTCASLTKAMSGGALSSGVYVLTSVTALGTKAFCAVGGGYSAIDHRGVLEVTATSTTSATFEFLDQYKKTGISLTRPTTNRYDVAVSASGTTLTYTAQSCAVTAAPPTAQYSVGLTIDSKKTIALRLPYGKGTAIFNYVEQ